MRNAETNYVYKTNPKLFRNINSCNTCKCITTVVRLGANSRRLMSALVRRSLSLRGRVCYYEGELAETCLYASAWTSHTPSRPASCFGILVGDGGTQAGFIFVLGRRMLNARFARITGLSTVDPSRGMQYHQMFHAACTAGYSTAGNSSIN